MVINVAKSGKNGQLRGVYEWVHGQSVKSGKYTHVVSAPIYIHVHAPIYPYVHPCTTTCTAPTAVPHVNRLSDVHAAAKSTVFVGPLAKLGVTEHKAVPHPVFGQTPPMP